MTAHHEEPCLRFPIEEYDRIGAELARKASWYAKMTDELDRITSPGGEPLTRRAPQARCGFAFRGTFSECRSDIDIHVGVLRRLLTDAPEMVEPVVATVQRLGRVRRYIAPSPVELFPHRSIEWAHRYSRPLIDGLWVDTNMNSDQMAKILVAAVRAAGLRWGDDVAVNFNSRSSLPCAG